MKQIFDRTRVEKVALSISEPQIKVLMRIWLPLPIQLAMTFRNIDTMYYY
jgi:hypothetical protein